MLRAIIAISTNFMLTIIFLLLSLSARTPAVDENSKNGITKIAPAEANIVVALVAPFICIRKNITNNLKMLSLRAPKN